MEKGKQIIIWGKHPELPTMKFVGCRHIYDSGTDLQFTYNGLSTGITSDATFKKDDIVGYAIEVEEE